MRIISGSVKGHRIQAPKGHRTRPALAKVREAIFSSLGAVKDKVVLDLYAGSGSLGLEALSRGAKKGYFVDSDSLAIRTLILNLKTLGFGQTGVVFKRHLPQGLKNVTLEPQPDIIFCDPPYDKNLVNKTLQTLLSLKIVDPKSWVIVEHSPRELPLEQGFKIVKQSQYGQTLVSYLKRVFHDGPITIS